MNTQQQPMPSAAVSERVSASDHTDVVKVPTRLWLWIVLLLLLVSAASLPASAADSGTPAFDHLTTGFALTGAHREAKCESCHLKGVLKGTPKVCAGCHSRGSRLQTTQLPVQHVPTGDGGCESCHRTNAWSPARFSHMEVSAGTCTSCHDGVKASGKSGTHISTSLSCDSCHRTSAWTPAKFDHREVVAGTCSGCHNGTQASGKPGNHIPTSQQ